MSSTEDIERKLDEMGITDVFERFFVGLALLDLERPDWDHARIVNVEHLDAKL